jgi:hypothetical protein
MNPNDVLLQLPLDHSKVFEVYHVEHFEGSRSAAFGHPQSFRLEIHDAGPSGNETLRYHAVVRTDSGHHVVSAFMPTANDALLTLRWQELDHPPKCPPMPSPCSLDGKDGFSAKPAAPSP